MQYLGDIAPSQILYFAWPTYAVDGSSITRATNGTVSVYKNDGTTQSTAGITDTEDFDALTGIHMCKIDTSADGTFYAAGNDFTVILSGATIDGKSVNAVIAYFSINNRSALRPTTAGRTLDVSATGEAGLDWANIGSPTTAQNLSGTNIDVDQVVASVSGAVGSVTGAVGSVAAGGITAASIATGAVDADALAADAVAEIADGVWDEDATGHQTLGTFGQAIGDPVADTDTIYGLVTNIQADADNIQTRLPAALVGGRMDSDVGAMQANVVTAAAIATDAIDADAIAANAIGASEFAQAAADKVWLSAARTLTALGFTLNTADFVAGFLTAGLIATDAIGAAELAADAVTEIQSGLATAAALATVQADTDDIQTRLPAALVGGRMDSSVGAMAVAVLTAAAIAADAIGASELAADAVAEIADGVWDELIAGHLGVGSTGEALNSASSGGDPWITPLPGAYGVGTAGRIVGDNVNATISSRATPAQVNAEVVDALATDTYAEPGQEAPPATTNLARKLGYLYKLMRNRVTETAAEQRVYADDAVTIDQKRTMSDDGVTFDRSELGTGP